MKEPNTEGYVLTINDEICGCCLLQFKKTKPMDNKELFVVENNGYLTRDYVFIKHRGNNLQQLMILKRIEILKQKKYKTATSYISFGNIASQHTYRKCSFKKCMMIITIKKVNKSYVKKWSIND